MEKSVQMLDRRSSSIGEDYGTTAFLENIFLDVMPCDACCEEIGISSQHASVVSYG
jgi:hypothetical protein